MNHVMIDIETLSTRANAVILSLAAVRFDPRTGQEADKWLCLKISIESCQDAGMGVDSDTLYWWTNQSQEAIRASFVGEKNSIPISVAIAELNDFVDPETDYVWGNPANFDLTIVENARIALGWIVPIWNRRNVMCLRTLKNLVPDSVYKTTFEGVPHDPLDDCRHQNKQVVKIYNHLGL